MSHNVVMHSKNEFEQDTVVLGQQTNRFLELVYPSYLLNSSQISEQHFERDGDLMLDSMTFFRISQCSIENADQLFVSLNAQIEKLFTALHSINIAIAYGIISYEGTTNLVLGVNLKKDVQPLKSIVEGILTGVELEHFTPSFSKRPANERSYGMLSGLPTVSIEDQKQTFSLASIMRSLNGTDYTLLFLAKPVSSQVVMHTIGELLQVRDQAFAISKKNVARSMSSTETESITINESDSKNKNSGGIAAGIGTVVGGVVGSFFGPGVGTMAGSAIGGGLGMAIGSALGGSTHTKGYSEAISKAIMESEAISADVQNGFALELMNYADHAIDRLKAGQNNGIWQSAITYSADTEMAKNIIQACLCSELSRPDPNKLPLLTFSPRLQSETSQQLLIPSFINENVHNPLCSHINSAELGLMCTFPIESVPDFELRIAKQFPLIKSVKEESDVVVGNVVEGKRIVNNMPFALSLSDLNKHTFVCGITGSGKTTTVKRILNEARKPFLVIESAKKEYRNMAVQPQVYTLGKPEINCPRINPFYIMPGVSPSVHIDYLKDLFNASFSFYGPMPYILEKCLHNVYKNKGWNLTLGFHPLLVNDRSNVDFFDINYIKKQYALKAHHMLFPTMQELKAEVERYINEEMNYEGEVAGNIKTAMKIRLENLCNGSKGFMFNTYEHPNFEKLLEQNAVFELEGVADDADKAFCVGLLLIFINEYRQVAKESYGNRKLELQHLLVIEEAHRLLKNVETERTSENMGNPKGKAVEHFTNMIAEMRSYGQGVIVAEQIPSKLAPDVIKNSSNKIIQRLVAADDQQIIANTIGIAPEDALLLGTLETGYALSHREGMALPVPVKVNNAEDIYVSDEALYNLGIGERIKRINISIARSAMYDGVLIKRKVLSLLNTLLTEEAELVVDACEQTMNELVRYLRRKDVPLIQARDVKEICAVIITEMLQSFLVRGVYAVNTLPDDETVELIERLLLTPSSEIVMQLKANLETLYGRATEGYAKRLVSELIKKKLSSALDISATIESYFVKVSDQTKMSITMLIGG